MTKTKMENCQKQSLKPCKKRGISALKIRAALRNDAQAIAQCLSDGEGYTDDIQTNTATFLKSPRHHGLVSVCTPQENVIYAGILLFRYRNRFSETFETHSIIEELSPKLFSANGDFCEVFDLWVAPSFRCQGVATQLKKALQKQLQHDNILTVYTHTESRHTHIIQWNQKLGYKIVREGPIWDKTPRTSLMLSL